MEELSLLFKLLGVTKPRYIEGQVVTGSPIILYSHSPVGS